ncbi:hypothetical protein WJX72_000550 [[Myrmecia] bisecta]|uniref:Uncharacterized protein n=1 Tax=[Myrmecia] bisecta TaxID=41462 RepID=A0AAW1Q6Z2_9CHLO
MEACLVVTWLTALVTAARGWRTGVTLQLRVLAWAALPLYAWATYTYADMYARHWGLSKPLAEGRLITSAVEVATVLLIAVAESCKKSTEEEDAALKEALLGRDPENPAEKKKRSWYSLLLTAALYVWPDTPMLQLRAVLCVMIVVFIRLLNLAVPVLYKHVVDTLSDVSSRTHPSHGEPPQTFTFWQVFYPFVLAYMVVAFLQGGPGTGSMGIMSNLRQYLWIPTTQNAYRRISLDVFSHTLDLDLKFHLLRKTGEVMRIMDRGTSSIQSVLSTIIFSVGPQLFDIAVACIYMASVMQPWIAVIVFVTLMSYIPLTIFLTEWRGQFRRELNKYDNAKGAKATDALLNYETVKYFGNEELERDNFAAAIQQYQKVEYKLLATLNILNVLQSAVIFTGMISGLIVCCKGVANGSLTVGDAVLFITLMQQLSAPLNWFGSYYRSLQTNFIDMENMFDLLASSPSTQDKPGAKALVPSSFGIEFDNVSFNYLDGSPVLRNVSWSIPGGQTLALVGATGSGKSTALRLLFRFYDPYSGHIRIDGQCLADVTQKSLRHVMAVVPQDTVLFNDTIEYNIRYGRAGATEAEVHAAAQAACIHETILNRFPQGYATIVGERGLRLSGGEKQRVAFARAILKNPSILLLDEATSSLDSMTEKRIQDALLVMRQDRTTVIVAHRLSTIMDADMIVVMKEGEVAETGSHPELIEQGGLYAEMWSCQEAAAIDKVGSSVSVASLAPAEPATKTAPPPAAMQRPVAGSTGSLQGHSQYSSYHAHAHH